MQDGPPIFLELFAGRASFSRAMIQSGFEVVSVDHKVGHPFAPIVSLDLTTESGKQILQKLLHYPLLFAIHLGLPCGTASRAREEPIPEELRSKGVPSPPQLRSALQNSHWECQDCHHLTKPKWIAPTCSIPWPSTFC